MISLGLNEQQILNLQRSCLFFLSPFRTFFLLIPYFFLRYKFDEVVLTNQKFHVRVGLISKEVFSIPLRKINNVAYKQGFIGRIFNYGTIYVQSAAAQGTLSYGGIINPELAKSQIEQAIEAAENK